VVRVIPVLLILAAAYWLAAPDPATAGARTAAGTGVRAAGSGARQHWAAGRKGRELRRTKRRDRWWKAGGLRRFLLRGEHGAVITGKAAKGAAKLTAAAARPVPAAVKRGWVQGMDRHQQRAGGRPTGLVLDPPWWRGVQPKVQPGDPQVQDAGAGREQVQVQAGEQPGNSPEVQPQGTGDEAAPDRWRVIVTEGRRGYEGHILLLDQTSELPEQYIADVKGRTPEKVRETAEWLIAAEQRDNGGGQPHQIEWIDQAGDPGPRLLKPDHDPTDTDLPAGTSPAGSPNQAPTTASREPHCANCGKRLEYNLRTARPRGVPVRDDPDSMWCPECARSQPADPPAGTSPAGTPSTTAIPTQGDPVPSYTTSANVPSVELNDLDSVRRFAEYIASLGEDSEFMQIVKQCKSFREQLREGGFGGHMDAAGSSFEETAGRLGQVGEEFCEEAQQVAGLAVNIAGG
jgi:hypothetical protein